MRKRFILSFKPWMLIDRYTGQQVQHCYMLAAASCQQASVYVLMNTTEGLQHNCRQLKLHAELLSPLYIIVA